jgi:hypothetical protein
MSIRPQVTPDKPFALQYAFDVDEGLTMQEAPRLAHVNQLGADRELGSSWRFPVLREFAFLYRDRFGPHGQAPRTTSAPTVAPAVRWFRHDVRSMFASIERVAADLPYRPQEYVSKWWRLATEGGLAAVDDNGLHGLQLSACFTENSFELPIVDAFPDDGRAPHHELALTAPDIMEPM